MGTLYEDLCTFMTYRWIIFRMRNTSEKLCTENQNTVYIHLIDFYAQ